MEFAKYRFLIQLDGVMLDGVKSLDKSLLQFEVVHMYGSDPYVDPVRWVSVEFVMSI